LRASAGGLLKEVTVGWQEKRLKVNLRFLRHKTSAKRTAIPPQKTCSQPAGALLAVSGCKRYSTESRVTISICIQYFYSKG
jgi:hypothetical protein